MGIIHRAFAQIALTLWKLCAVKRMEEVVRPYF